MKTLDEGTRLQKNERCGHTWLIISAERSRSGREEELSGINSGPWRKDRRKTNFLLPSPGPSEKGPENGNSVALHSIRTIFSRKSEISFYKSFFFF